MLTIEKLIDRLNIENSVPIVFTHDNIRLTNPVTDIGATWNTKLTVTAVPASGYTGSVDVYYRRIDLAALAGAAMVSEVPFTPELLINKLNAVEGSFVELIDVETITIPPMDTGVPTTITLVARADSLGWFGTVDISVAIGIPDTSNQLHTLLNQTLPAAGYF